MSAEVRVKSIFVYPIKSCRGISVAQAPISPTGFRWDREWMVVNGSSGRAYTQRVEPKLALIETHLPSEAFSSPNWEPKKQSYLEIRGPGMEQVLKVGLIRDETMGISISVWEWSGCAVDEGPAAAQWFSTYLGKPARLVRFHDASQVRNVEAEYAPGHNLKFADMYPFLLLSQGSMDALNALLKDPIPVNRFRPNILVDGCEAFSEDVWSEMVINDSTFKGVKLCSRCKVPTINQESGIVGGPEPTETLQRFRSDKALSRPNNKQHKGKVYFGQNLVCADSLTLTLTPTRKSMNAKSIRVGDVVVLLKFFSSAANAPA